MLLMLPTITPDAGPPAASRRSRHGLVAWQPAYWMHGSRRRFAIQAYWPDRSCAPAGAIPPTHLRVLELLISMPLAVGYQACYRVSTSCLSGNGAQAAIMTSGSEHDIIVLYIPVHKIFSIQSSKRARMRDKHIPWQSCAGVPPARPQTNVRYATEPRSIYRAACVSSVVLSMLSGCCAVDARSWLCRAAPAPRPALLAYFNLVRLKSAATPPPGIRCRPHPGNPSTQTGGCGVATGCAGTGRSSHPERQHQVRPSADERQRARFHLSIPTNGDDDQAQNEQDRCGHRPSADSVPGRSTSVRHAAVAPQADEEQAAG